MPELVVELRHTADLGSATREKARTLLETVFDGDFHSTDWEHALGGISALGWSGEALIGHVSVVQRSLLHRDRALRTGYVEGFGVHPSWRRQGVGSRLMAEIERVIRSAYEAGALGATDEAIPLYEGRGWRRWRGRTSTVSPAGIVRTPDEDDCVYVFDVTEPFDVDGDIACDFREGDAW